jgi:uncharacterized membrane protein YphA (DoxX/SURF4 family)
LEGKLGETLSFFILTLAATWFVLVFAVWNRSVLNSQAMARGSYSLSLFLSSASLLYVLLGVFVTPMNAGGGLLLRVLIYRGWLVIGTGISSTLLILLNAFVGLQSPFNGDATRSFLTSQYLLRGICLSVAISFLCTEIGKLAHDADMRQFFVQSGYPVWFLYFIITSETVGAIGLLLPKVILPSAFSLAAIMLGAIYTHFRNRDPFSDSLEALHLLILLACIAVILLVRGRVERRKE